MSMLSLNKQLFLILNAHKGASLVAIFAARIMASDVVGLAPLLLAALWIWGEPRLRSGLIATAIIAALALLTNQLAGLFWYEPRPFMIGLGHTMMQHAPENSFPSDHATFLFAIGFGLIATGAGHGWGKLVILSGILVSWARIYVGLHFPLDMLASAVIAAIFAIISVLLVKPIQRRVIPIAEQVYDSTLNLLGLPERFFPRHDDD